MYPSDLAPILRIFDCDVEDIFYSPSKKQFYTKNKHYKLPSTKKLKPIIWNRISRSYTTKNNGTKVYSYRYVNIPYQTSYLRVRDDEWESFSNGDSPQPDSTPKVDSENIPAPLSEK